MPYRGQGARHAQRQFPQTKAKPQPEGSNTAWMPEFISALAGTTEPLTLKSIVVIGLGANEQEREQRLRELARMGVLKMEAVRLRTNGERAKLGEPSVFSHYEWKVL